MGFVQKMENDGSISLIKFSRTEINFSGLSTKTISEIKIQETPTLDLINCTKSENMFAHNCSRSEKNIRDTKIELNKRFGMPIFIPLVALICCFLLSSRRDKKYSGANKYIYFVLSFVVLVASEITVRYSGISINHTFFYYLIPIALFPLTYLLLLKTFKYENMK